MMTNKIKNTSENIPSPRKISKLPYFQRFLTLDFIISTAAKKAITAINIFSVRKALAFCVGTF